MDDIKSRLRKAADDVEAMRRHAANMIDSDCEPHWSEQTEMEEASITAVEAAAYIERLEVENARLKSDRLYVLGCNDGYDAAMDQAAEFCDGAEASWRETADKAHELDHNEAMGWSTTATAKAETCAGLASTIRTATTIPLIRQVGLCLLDEDRATLKGGDNG